MSTTIESLLTISEVKTWLKVSESTIYHWVNAGTFPYLKIGGRLRFDPNDIRKWIKKRNSAA